MAEPDQPSQRKGANFLLVGAGTMFTAMVISGFLVGYVFDELLGTRPFGMLFCGLLGMIGGMMNVHKVSTQMDRQAADKTQSEKTPTDADTQS